MNPITEKEKEVLDFNAEKEVLDFKKLMINFETKREKKN